MGDRLRPGARIRGPALVLERFSTTVVEPGWSAAVDGGAALILKNDWERLGPLLRGKLHIYMGTLDTYRLEGALKLLKADLDSLQSDAEILLVEGRDHGTLFRPHPELWPQGMMSHIHNAMRARWDRQLRQTGDVP